MSPWEQESLLASLIGDLAAEPPGLVAELRAELDRFRADWRSVWAAHGESAAGWPDYRRLLAGLEARLGRFEGRLRLANRAEAVEIVRQMVVRPGLNPELAPRAPRCRREARRRPSGSARPLAFDRPMFIVSSPRAGSSLLFETLAQAPGLWTIGGEGHARVRTGSRGSIRPAAAGSPTG